MSLPPAVSPDVIIMTRAELRAREQAAYKRGVERGRFEESCDRAKTIPAPGLGAHQGAVDSHGMQDSVPAGRPANP